MNQKIARDYGVSRGSSIVEVNRVDYAAMDYDDIICSVIDTENESRCYSPFEFFARDANDTGDRAEGIWDAYDNGVISGARMAIKKFKLGSQKGKSNEKNVV